MVVTRTQEIWALALWVGQTHGERGERFIAEQFAQFEATESPQAVSLWSQVAHRYGQMDERSQSSD